MLDFDFFCDLFFFFQAEDGIRDHCVTGVQTCALPISAGLVATRDAEDGRDRSLGGVDGLADGGCRGELPDDLSRDAVLRSLLPNAGAVRDVRRAIDGPSPADERRCSARGRPGAGDAT